MDATPKMRALLAVAAAGREVADSAYGIVSGIAHPVGSVERIRAWRELRLKALSGLDRAVLLELLAGATWETVAEGYGLSPAEMQARFGPTLEQWLTGTNPAPAPGATGEFTPGLPFDEDPAGTADALDLWVMRHAEPWAGDPGRPVSTAIARA